MARVAVAHDELVESLKIHATHHYDVSLGVALENHPYSEICRCRSRSRSCRKGVTVCKMYMKSSDTVDCNFTSG